MRRQKYPLVSIITVVFNGETTIERTIKSVLAQTYPRIEYIIIDGMSNDSTPELLKKYAKKISKIVRESDRGIYDAMNKGVALASGDIVGILNADDCYLPDTVKHAVECLNNEGLVVTHGKMIRQGTSGKLRTVSPACDQPTSLRKLGIYHPTMFVPIAIYQKYGFFSLDYQTIADWDFIYRLAKNKVKFVSLDIEMVVFEEGGASSKNDFSRLAEKYAFRKANSCSAAIIFTTVDMVFLIMSKVKKILIKKDN